MTPPPTFGPRTTSWPLMLADALRRQIGTIPIALHLPYVPTGVRDRVCNRGSAGGKGLRNLINSIGFASVTILDPHSDVVTALPRPGACSSTPLVPLARVVERDDFRAGSLAGAGCRRPQAGERPGKQVGLRDVAFAERSAPPSARSLRSRCRATATPAGPGGDDICDGAAPFTALAAAPARETDQPLYLYVSGIFPAKASKSCSRTTASHPLRLDPIRQSGRHGHSSGDAP